MKVLLPLPSLASVNTVMCGASEGRRTLIEKYKDRDLCSLVLLHSKDAAWDRKLNSYVLNYKGRANQVTQSAQSFIIIVAKLNKRFIYHKLFLVTGPSREINYQQFDTIKPSSDKPIKKRKR